MSMLATALLLASVTRSPAAARDTCSMLERRTQAFSEAGQRGDGAAMAEALDPEVVFFNETGARARRAEMASTTPPPAGTPVRSITTTDWDCRLHGDVAVTSFIDVLQKGRPDELRFRSVETWRKAPGGWRMIGSETLTLHPDVEPDPDTVALDGEVLDGYAGRYESTGGTRFSFSHRGDGLVASVDGGPESAQKAQARDIFFTPGRSSTPKVFQRDDGGRVTGFVYLRGKNSLTFKRVGSA